MQLCSKDHEEVAFVSSWNDDCPACRYAEDVREEMQATIDSLERQVEELQDELYNATAE